MRFTVDKMDVFLWAEEIAAMALNCYFSSYKITVASEDVVQMACEIK